MAADYTQVPINIYILPTESTSNAQRLGWGCVGRGIAEVNESRWASGAFRKAW